ncbi:hypothetical protein H4219_002476 [Mycoemilia scoparia]|uniref:Uncharacterized protein n=1 Tax=Mycoemilia scoparia TaxID=417184 RepID=A0A9W8DP31_9FUNG|nr:hypothetical protein H4219_002476 [Mycoemilia scoparia]
MSSIDVAGATDNAMVTPTITTTEMVTLDGTPVSMPPISQLLGNSTGLMDGGWAYRVIFVPQPPLTDIAKGFDIAGLVLSFCVLMTVIYRAFKIDIFERPSFRLSASIAIGNILCLLSEVILTTDRLTKGKSSTSLKVLVWLRIFGIAVFVFATMFIAFHLHMTILLNKSLLARKLNKFYELITWTLCAIIASPAFYGYKETLRHPDMGIVFHVDKTLGHMRMVSILIYVWMIVAIGYCTIISIVVMVRLVPSLRRVWILERWKHRLEKKIDTNEYNLQQTRQLGSDNVGDPRPESKKRSRILGGSRGRGDIEAGNGNYNHNRSSTDSHAHHRPVFSPAPADNPNDDGDGVSEVSSITSFHIGNNNRLDQVSLTAFNKNPRGTYFDSKLKPKHEPYGVSNSSSHTLGRQSQVRKEQKNKDDELSRRKRQISFVIIRIALQTILPLLSTPWIPIFMCIRAPPTSFANLIKFTPFLNALLGFVTFVIHPELNPSNENAIDRYTSGRFQNALESLWTKPHKLGGGLNKIVSNPRLAGIADGKANAIMGFEDSISVANSSTFVNDKNVNASPNNYDEGVLVMTRPSQGLANNMPTCHARPSSSSQPLAQSSLPLQNGNTNGINNTTKDNYTRKGRLIL